MFGYLSAFGSEADIDPGLASSASVVNDPNRTSRSFPSVAAVRGPYERADALGGCPFARTRTRLLRCRDLPPGADAHPRAAQSADCNPPRAEGWRQTGSAPHPRQLDQAWRTGLELLADLPGLRRQEPTHAGISPRAICHTNDRLIRPRFRPILLCGRNDDWLFPGQHGRAKASTLFSGQITNRIYQATGLRITVHQFRHAAGAIFLKRRPGEYEIV